MFGYFWPLILIVCSNVIYNIMTKETPENANPFLSLVITYLVGAVVAFIFYIILGEKNILGDLKKINWTSWLLGISIVGLEAGYIYLYRSGWKISLGSLTANISLAVILMLIGVLFYKEPLSIKQVLGAVLCAVGLILIK